MFWAISPSRMYTYIYVCVCVKQNTFLYIKNFQFCYSASNCIHLPVSSHVVTWQAFMDGKKAHDIINEMNVSQEPFKSNQIKSNHFYCHITTAQVPWCESTSPL